MLLATTNRKPNLTWFKHPGRFQDITNVPKLRLLVGKFRKSRAQRTSHSSPLHSLAGQLGPGLAHSGAPHTGMIYPEEKGCLGPLPPFKSQGSCPVTHTVLLARARSTCSPKPIVGKSSRPGKRVDSWTKSGFHQEEKGGWLLDRPERLKGIFLLEMVLNYLKFL